MQMRTQQWKEPQTSPIVKETPGLFLCTNERTSPAYQGPVKCEGSALCFLSKHS